MPINLQPEDQVTVNSENVTKRDLEDFLDQFEATKEEARNLKKDTMAVFGIFAALLVFVTLEIQLIKSIERFSLLIGFSAFFLASMLLFVLGIHQLITANGDINKVSFRAPIFKLLGLFLFIALVCFIYAFLFKSGVGLLIGSWLLNLLGWHF